MIEDDEVEITTRRKRRRAFQFPIRYGEPLKSGNKNEFMVIQEIKLPNGIIIQVKSKNAFHYSKVPEVLLEELIKFYK